jgi:hypothetical protein
MLTRKDKLIYVCDNINELSFDDKLEMLKIIMRSDIDPDKVQEKGNGTQITTKNLSDKTVSSLYSFVNQKIDSDELMFPIQQ